MKVRLRFVLPALLALAGCGANTPPMDASAANAATTSAAPPQRVDAASDALGQRLDSMLARSHVGPTTVTR